MVYGCIVIHIWTGALCTEATGGGVKEEEEEEEEED